MSDEPQTRREADQGVVGKAMFVADLINRLGMAVFISGAVVVVSIGWLVGWFQTPWVTPTDFQNFNRIYMQVHDAQNAIHLESLTESRKQTKVLMLQRCDAMDSTVDERKQCYREAAEH